MIPFNQLEKLEAKELMPGFKGKFIHTETMTIAYWEIKKGSVLPEHSHPHEQTTNVLSGTLQLTVDNITSNVEYGEVVTIGSNIVHSGIAITDCIVLDVFSPVREDYKVS